LPQEFPGDGFTNSAGAIRNLPLTGIRRLRLSTDLLLEEARRKAYDGVDKPVFYQGQVCSTVRKYSGTLLMFKIQGERPKYNRACVNVELTGIDCGPIEITPALSVKFRELYAWRQRVVDVSPRQLTDTAIYSDNTD
jgi:hypothetical protein